MKYQRFLSWILVVAGSVSFLVLPWFRKEEISGDSIVSREGVPIYRAIFDLWDIASSSVQHLGVILLLLGFSLGVFAIVAVMWGMSQNDSVLVHRMSKGVIASIGIAVVAIAFYSGIGQNIGFLLTSESGVMKVVVSEPSTTPKGTFQYSIAYGFYVYCIVGVAFFYNSLTIVEDVDIFE